MKSLHLLITSLGIASLAMAEITVDQAYDSHMVLPQGKKVPITGTSTEKTPLTISFDGQSVQAKPDAKGKWIAYLAPMKANSKGQTLTIKQGNDTKSLEDILVGEVWLASGQSNMMWRLNQTPSGKQNIPQAGNDQLRILNKVAQVHTAGSAYKDTDLEKLTPEKFYTGTWAVSSPQSAAPTSAVAYYTAKNLQEALKVPVGIIHCSLGGSEMAAWFPSETINSQASLKSLRGNDWLKSDLLSPWVKLRSNQNIGQYVKKGKPMHPFKPGFLFDSGIKQFTNLPISGVIWYQGESDAESRDNKQLMMLLNTLVSSWEKEFKNPQLPFVMVQLPRINDKAAIRACWPEFREAQQQIADQKNNVYCVNTIDLGSTNSDVHPPEKLEVGKRLSNTILSNVYKKKAPHAGPSLKNMKIKGNKVYLQFDHAKGLSTTDDSSPKLFEIAGGDGEYKPAQATIQKPDIIILESDEVKTPKHVRYAWATFVEPNLVNGENLPANQFRSDAPKTK